MSWMTRGFRKVYFSRSELSCKHCGEYLFDEDFLKILNLVRHSYGKAIQLNSAYRCRDHNEAVGGKKTSAHRKGKAVDIRCESDADRWKLVNLLIKHGVTRIGVGKDFIHADVDQLKNKERMWVY